MTVMDKRKELECRLKTLELTVKLAEKQVEITQARFGGKREKENENEKLSNRNG